MAATSTAAGGSPGNACCTWFSPSDRGLSGTGLNATRLNGDSNRPLGGRLWAVRPTPYGCSAQKEEPRPEPGLHDKRLEGYSQDRPLGSCFWKPPSDGWPRRKFRIWCQPSDAMKVA